MHLEVHTQGHHFISVANDALKDPIPNITKPRHHDLNLDVYVVLTTVIDLSAMTFYELLRKIWVKKKNIEKQDLLKENRLIFK